MNLRQLLTCCNIKSVRFRLDIIKLNRDHRKIYGEKMVELANIALGGLVLGQLISGKLSGRVVFLGLAIFTLCYIISYFLLRR